MECYLSVNQQIKDAARLLAAFSLLIFNCLSQIEPPRINVNYFYRFSGNYISEIHTVKKIVLGNIDIHLFFTMLIECCSK
jgi:hypothetical protein